MLTVGHGDAFHYGTIAGEVLVVDGRHHDVVPNVKLQVGYVLVVHSVTCPHRLPFTGIRLIGDLEDLYVVTVDKVSTRGLQIIIKHC